MIKELLLSGRKTLKLHFVTRVSYKLNILKILLNEKKIICNLLGWETKHLLIL